MPHSTAPRRWSRLAAPLAVAALLILVSLPGMLDQVRDVDVLLYSAAAVRSNAEGALPYVAAWIEKGPLAMGLFQALFAVFGPYNPAAVWCLWLVMALAGAALAWGLAAESVGPGAGAQSGRRAGAWAAVLFAVSIGAVGGTLNTEVPATVAAAAAVLVWCCSRRLALLAGVLVGAAFLCRQNAGILWPLLVVAEGWMAVSGRRTWREAGAAAAALSGGFLLIVGGTVSLYAATGHLGAFLLCFYSYNAGIYVAATKVTAARLLASPLTAAQNFLLPIRTTAVLGVAGMVAALVAWRGWDGTMPRIGTGGADGSAEQRPGARATAGLVVAASALVLTASLFIGLRFFTHYFALALPFWAALGGLAVERVSGIAGRVRRPHSAGRIPDRAPSRRLAWGGLIIGSIVALSLGLEVAGRPWRAAAVQTRRWVLSGGLARAGDPLLWPGRDPLAAKVARWVREHSASSDRIFVWGTRPHVAAYALRIPATHFVTCTFLTGLVPWERSAPEEDTSRWIVPGSWELLLRDLEVERPLFIVDASQDHLFGDGAYAPARFPRLAAILAERYEPVFEAGEGDRMVVHRRKAP